MKVTKNQLKHLNALAKGMAGVAVVLASLTSLSAHADCATGGIVSFGKAKAVQTLGQIERMHSYLQDAADCGLSEAQYREGIWYLDSNNPGMDEGTAKWYLGRAKAQGHERASNALGALNIGTPKRLVVMAAHFTDPK